MRSETVDLGEAGQAKELEREGFLVIPMPSDLRQRVRAVRAAARRFFALPVDNRARNMLPFGCGYWRHGAEHSGDPAEPDRVDFFGASARTQPHSSELPDLEARELNDRLLDVFDIYEGMAEGIVGDLVADRKAAVASRGFDADKPTRADAAQVCEWLAAAGYATRVFDKVADFIPAARERLPDAIVLPLWRGGPSRNRASAVPVVCEEFGIAYVGGDAFVHIVTQDKSLSKVFARKAGFQVAGEWLIPAERDLADFAPSRRLRPPFVVKPQYSGSSIGVEEPSLCTDDGQAMR